MFPLFVLRLRKISESNINIIKNNLRKHTVHLMTEKKSTQQSEQNTYIEQEQKLL